MGLFILAANFGITSLGNKNTAVYDPVFLVTQLIAVVTLYLFIRHTRRSAEPFFIPMRLLRAKGFAVMNSLNLLWGVVGFGLASLAPASSPRPYHLVPSAQARCWPPAASGPSSSAPRPRWRCGGPATGCLWRWASSWWRSAPPPWPSHPRLGLSPYVWLGVGAGLTGVGNGLANPASRNACLQIAPNEVAAITGLRQMFVFMGIIFSVSTVTAILNRSADPGLAQAHILWVAAGVLLAVMVPLVFRVPEHKGSW